jgi:hypothetical protein
MKDGFVYLHVCFLIVSVSIEVRTLKEVTDPSSSSSSSIDLQPVFVLVETTAD